MCRWGSRARASLAVGQPAAQARLRDVDLQARGPVSGPLARTEGPGEIQPRLRTARAWHYRQDALCEVVLVELQAVERGSQRAHPTQPCGVVDQSVGVQALLMDRAPPRPCHQLVARAKVGTVHGIEQGALQVRAPVPRVAFALDTLAAEPPAVAADANDLHLQALHRQRVV